ncbi:MAG: SpoIIE family protein phosphatase [Pseudomonadota bacterium]
MPIVDCYLLKRSLEGPRDACGDGGVILESDDELFLALLDVLGHGREAHAAAVMAEEFLVRESGRGLKEIMVGLHSHLQGTRGAVAALCRLNKNTGELSYVGVGNINSRIYGPRPRHLIPRDGIIGYSISTPLEQKTELGPGDILVCTSDGVREHFDLDDYPDLFRGSARRIAADIIEKLGKGDDDASCIVLRREK